MTKIRISLSKTPEARRQRGDVAQKIERFIQLWHWRNIRDFQGEEDVDATLAQRMVHSVLNFLPTDSSARHPITTHVFLAVPINAQQYQELSFGFRGNFRFEDRWIVATEHDPRQDSNMMRSLHGLFKLGSHSRVAVFRINVAKLTNIISLPDLGAMYGFPPKVTGADLRRQGSTILDTTELALLKQFEKENMVAEILRPER